jgi:hypothetical protein
MGDQGGGKRQDASLYAPASVTRMALGASQENEPPAAAESARGIFTGPPGVMAPADH